ncbi:hypothetical protein HLB35_15595 [Halomonas sp. TBZ9]|uniref:Uncharacterized protein n=1 Tax=Vreelandella azerica TaxID=2732867 RepID=A0A7Y3TZ11_9GAMM|nr:hypothetical protein [Halomonas azerica]NOG32822.1 hypothetical protein [Halomonas azerica]
MGGKGAGIAGTVGVNIVNNTTLAALEHSNLSLNAGDEADVHIIATDSASVWSLAGALGFGSKAGFGVAIGINTLTNSTEARLADTRINQAESVTIDASARGLIRSAAVGVGVSSAVGGSGSVSGNIIVNEINANLTRSRIEQTSGEVAISAYNQAVVLSYAGAVAGGAKAGVAGSLAANFVIFDQAALVNGGTINANALNVSSISDTLVFSVGFGAAAAGKGGFAGAVTISTIAGQTLAEIGGGAEVSVDDDIDVQAQDITRVAVIAFGAAGASTVAGGGSLSTTILDNAVIARVADDAVLTTASDINVFAGLSEESQPILSLRQLGIDVDLKEYGVGSSDADDASDAGLAARSDDFDLSAGVINISFAGAGAGTVAGSGAVGLNWLRSSVRAEVSGQSTRLNAGGDITVVAKDQSAVINVAFAVAGAGTVAGGAAIAFNYIGGDPTNPSRSLQSEDDIDTSQDLLITNVQDNNEREFVAGEVAAVIEGAELVAGGDITVDAQAESILANLTAGGAAAGTVALSGSIGINFVRHQVVADISDGADVTGRSVQVTAGLAPISINIAGSANGSGTVGLAGASATTDINTAVRASIRGAATSVTATEGDVVVDALMRRITEGVYEGINERDLAQADVDNTDPDADIADEDDDKTPLSVLESVGLVDTDDAPGLPTPTQAGDQIFTAAISGAGSGQVAIAGALSLNWMRSTAEAVIEGATVKAYQGDVSVKAEDRLGMNAFTIAAGASGAVSALGYMAYNYIGGNPGSSGDDDTNVVRARIDDAAVTATNIEVQAISDSAISSYTVGASVSVYASMVGSVALNFTTKDVEAEVTGSKLTARGGDIVVNAQDTSTIISGAVQLSVAVYGGSVGVTVSLNDITNTISAGVKESALTAEDGGSIIVTADASAITMNVVGGVSFGTFVSAAANSAATVGGNTVDAYIKGRSSDASAYDIVADGHVLVHANSNDRNFVIAGTVSAGLVAGGIAVGVNLMGSDTSATVSDNVRVRAEGNGSTVDIFSAWDSDDDAYETESGRGVAVLATSRLRYTHYAVSAGGGAVGLGANLSVDSLAGSTNARVENAHISSGQDVTVRALHATQADSGGGTLAGGIFAGAAAIDTSLASHRTLAEVVGNRSGIISADGDVRVDAQSDVRLETYVVGVSIGLVSVAGSASALDVSSSTSARIMGISVDADNILVQSKSETLLTYIVGTAAAGLSASLGASLSVGLISPDTTAEVHGAALTAKGDITVAADQRAAVEVTMGTVSLDGLAAVAGTVSVLTSDASASAFVGDLLDTDGHVVANSTLKADGDINITAVNRTIINPWDEFAANFIGTLSAGGVAGAGASVDVMVLRETVYATVGDNTTLEAGNQINIDAHLERDLTSLVMGFSVSVGAALTGSISVLSLGQGLRDGTRDTFMDEDDDLSQLFNDTFGNAADYQLNNERQEDVDDVRVEQSDDSGAINAPVGSEIENPNADTQSSRDRVNNGLLNNNLRPELPRTNQVEGDITVGDVGANVGRNATLTAGGDIDVSARETLDVDVIVGSGGGALLGAVGASVSPWITRPRRRQRLLAKRYCAPAIRSVWQVTMMPAQARGLRWSAGTWPGCIRTSCSSLGCHAANCVRR